MSDNRCNSPGVAMTDLILHHFDSSPFSEKVRLVLGFKQLTWRSVKVPVMLPKPDAVALTGGYRRTPFLQIGADIYCDTALMCRVIDQRAPEPPLYPAAATGLQHIVAQWADAGLFWAAAPYTMQPVGIAHVIGNASPDAIKALAADRAAMTAGMRRPTPVDAAAQLADYCGRLESMLAGHRFLLGDQPCIADFAAAHALWFIRLAPPLAALLAPFSRLAGWYERVIGFGHGREEPFGSGDAIAIAAAASGHAPTAVEPGLGLPTGAEVTVSATDYAADLVPGTLVGLSTGEVVIERRDERAGTVHVHFPRIGYQVKKAS
jgi:glutathione S-transferase